jgi:hypothetical protein
MLFPLPGQIDDELAIMRMVRALASLSDDFIQFKQSRLREYRKAQINEHHIITLFDTTAYRREVLRRVVMKVTKKEIAA